VPEVAAVNTFAEVVRARAGDGQVGVVFGPERHTWGSVVQEAADRAAFLSDTYGASAQVTTPGRPDERTGRQLHIGVLLENVPDYLYWTCAAALAGAVVVGINPTRRGPELAADIRHTDCDLIITEDSLARLLSGLDHGVPAERIHNVDDPFYENLLSSYRGAGLPAALPSPGAILLLLFSSGSTGAPKAVICSQGRFGMLARTMQERTELTRDSVSYLSMPLFHGNSMMMNFAPSMYTGATLCLARKFSASGFVRDLHSHGVTYVNYVGRALSYVLAVPEDPRDRASTLRLAAGTEASVADAERFSGRFGCRVSEGYGQSEGMVRINRPPGAPPGSIGLPLGGADVRVMSEETGQECPRARTSPQGRLLNPGESIGQIVVRGAAARFEGYYKNPEAQAERVRGDDFWTGDLAYRDQDGYFYFAGRSTDWLRVDSENFAAGPVERIIERWPDAAVSLVYAVPDPRTGDQVMCALQMADGVKFDPQALASFLDGQPDLGTKWRPRFVRIIDRVPVTGNHKTTKTGLRREAWLTDDPVYWCPDPGSGYRPLRAADREALATQFATHGRTALLPE
jgi:fatty-acyl-CoA synthase